MKFRKIRDLSIFFESVPMDLWTFPAGYRLPQGSFSIPYIGFSIFFRLVSEILTQCAAKIGKSHFWELLGAFLKG